MSDKPKFNILFLGRGHGVGPLLLARSLKQRGHYVSLIKPENAVRAKNKSWDFILVSTILDRESILTLEKAINITKAKNPKAVIILGGHGLSRNPEAFLRYFRAQYGLIGEADNTIGELFEVFETYGTNPNWSKIKHIVGICRRANNNRIYSNKIFPIVSAEQVKQLPVLPVFDSNGFVCHIYPQRGCPNNCAFCSKMPIKVRSMDIDKILNLMEHIKDKHPNIDQISFNGELFLLPHNTRCFIEGIKKRGLAGRFILTSDFTVASLCLPSGEVNKKLIDELIKCGFEIFGLGVESFCDSTLAEFNKPQKSEQIIKLIFYLIDKDVGGYFYTIFTSIRMRLAQTIVNNYIGLLLVCDNLICHWSRISTTLSFNSLSPMFNQYKDKPRRFAYVKREKNSEYIKYKRLPSNTNIERFAKDNLLKLAELMAVPYDEGAIGLDNSIDALYVMEERVEYIETLLAQGIEFIGELNLRMELDKLKEELPHCRLLVRQMPNLVWGHAIECIESSKLYFLNEVADHPDFLKQFEQEQPELFEQTKEKVAKELFGDSWQLELEKETNKKKLKNRIIEEIVQIAGEKDSKILPQNIVREQVKAKYEKLLEGDAKIYNVLTPTGIIQIELDLMQSLVVSAFRQITADQAAELALQSNDPTIWIGRIAVNTILSFCQERLSIMAKVNPRYDSRPVLAEYFKSTKYLKKLARKLPEINT